MTFIFDFTGIKRKVVLVVGVGQKSPNGGYNRLGMRESRARHLRSKEDAPK